LQKARRSSEDFSPAESIKQTVWFRGPSIVGLMRLPVANADSRREEVFVLLIRISKHICLDIGKENFPRESRPEGAEFALRTQSEPSHPERDVGAAGLINACEERLVTNEQEAASGMLPRYRRYDETKGKCFAHPAAVFSSASSMALDALSSRACASRKSSQSLIILEPSTSSGGGRTTSSISLG
jgi:hypothetical protein